ncbi:MAG: Inosine-5'-monophosphate dehydrogenase [Candidatus Heimdallarchaeota archaeon LC_3]|nr:MAG: Inosine-5'-monophosphate dehydrogenase [Candidatus Heimdallarchaeota archaeon LC_3]
MNRTIRTGLTFEDVLLVPKRFSGSSRSNISTRTQYSKNFDLNIPIISSNMDTVTESTMAIAIAREGGLGVIHRFMPIDDQVYEVIRVKRSESIIIDNPYTLKPDALLSDAKELMLDKGVSGILITTKNGTLEGILTNRDMKFEINNETTVSALMTQKKDLITANPKVSLDDAKAIFKKNKVEKLPLINEDGILSGLITASDLEKRELSPRSTKDNKGRLRVGAAIGVKNDILERAKSLLEVKVDSLVVDIAHGHSDLAINTVKLLRKEFGDDIDICAGNVATKEGTEDLISAGVDSIKAGVGPGSICITRIVAGSGVPQITCIMDCAEVAEGSGVPIISDGGIRNSGDIAKAIVAGASSVMIGNLLAGTTESPGSPIIRNGRRYKIIRGMASLGASLGRHSREKNGNGKGVQKKGSFDEKDIDDFASEVVAEGVEAMVAFKGPVKEIIHQLVGGLKSGISYCGSNSLPEMRKKGEFMQITAAGIKESQSHDVDKV